MEYKNLHAAANFLEPQGNKVVVMDKPKIMLTHKGTAILHFRPELSFDFVKSVIIGSNNAHAIKAHPIE